MSTLRARTMEAMRLCILQLLAEADGYQVHVSTLVLVLRDMLFDAPADVLAGQLAWLERNGLIKLVRIEDVEAAVLTPSGDEVRLGVVAYPGVKRPSPRG